MGVELDFRKQVGKRDAEEDSGRKPESDSQDVVVLIKETLDSKQKGQGAEWAHQ
jgi:hypothetical protein